MAIQLVAAGAYAPYPGFKGLALWLVGCWSERSECKRSRRAYLFFCHHGSPSNHH